jgi:hypothetical protein
MKNSVVLVFAMASLFLCQNLYAQKSATYNEVVSKAKTGQIDRYITQNGEEFNVGDSITLGVSFRNEQFDFIQQNAGIEYYPLPNLASNSKVVIKKIIIRGKSVMVNTTKAQGFVYGLTIMNFDSAITNGEIKSKIMTSDQALEELKKWKDKLDLELISQEEYNLKKEELIKFIKN